MSNFRFEAINKALNRPKIEVPLVSNKVSDYFASNVFTSETMQNYLSKEVFLEIEEAVNKGKKIDRNVANQVATAMKTWAMEKGATAFCHWFQPLTGSTAEMHHNFFRPLSPNKGIEAFSGKELVQQEPDSSNFPSGGLRFTFEARGYTAWDASSPAFVMSSGSGKTGKTLCIPTIFVSYTGEALDYKAPLLRSERFLAENALEVCHYFNKNVHQVKPTFGWEQEYFLVDEALYFARPDLVATGRTLVGRVTPKGQQLSDHYFGSIPERVYAYMLDFEQEAFKLGIAMRTRHNEVAPGQYECTPVFSDANVSVDKNQLLIDIMDRVALRHGFRVLLHEKPFAKINGSGKHSSWSMVTDTGINLLAPGRTPKTNFQFISFFIIVMKALNDYADLIRAATTSASNEQRLGVQEAPSTIMSLFIGSTFKKVIAALEKKVKKHLPLDEYDKQDLKLNIHNQIPDILIANTDRNRTAPLAFTGKKLELRMVGASTNCALPVTILNTIVGNQLKAFKQQVDKLIKEKKENKDGAIWRVLRQYLAESEKIRHEGDKYSEEWTIEAEKLGLKNEKRSPYALDFFQDKFLNKVLVDNNIYSERELEAHYEVWQGIYRTKIDIEARTLEEMVQNQIIPIATQYQNQLLQGIQGALAVGISKKTMKSQIQLVETIVQHITALQEGLVEMQNRLINANKHDHIADKARAYCDEVKPCFETIRQHADALELLVDDQLWTLPKYRELLYVR